jgi:amylosucrase
MVDPGRAALAALLAAADHDEVLPRYDRWGADLRDGLAAVYDLETALPRVLEIVAAGHRDRSDALRRRDRDRLLRPDWFADPSAVGYVAYADRFAGDLEGVRARIPYLARLGVTYLHLMPLLEPRQGPNDGGYAVADYRSVRPDLGTVDDLAALTADLHDASISLTLDLVLNHVAREHAWAAAARGGDPRYRGYFHVYPDRTEPNAYERTLPEVFPAFAPGNFSWDDDLRAWVWTTFNTWQWDLDWSNPEVFFEFAEIVLYLANLGVDCLRLDAIAFIWKRLGTNCQNQPEVHVITQALRALVRIAAPSVVFKAEAIVAPDDLVAYLGTGSHAGKVSDLAYHNSLMVQIWSTLATRDGRLMAAALNRVPPIPTTTAWATYLRCHDDIGWAIDDADAASVGWDGAAHRSFLSDFYSGEFAGTFARGAVFQPNEATGDRRISGSAASLAGLEAALAEGDAPSIELAVARLRCAYAMVLGFGGLPLLYMGDEVALVSDADYARDPAHADDNRWMHRPEMPWGADGLPHSLPEGGPTAAGAARAAAQVDADLRHLVRTRVSLAALHASVATTVQVPGDPAIVLFVRRHAAGTLVQAYNVSEREVRLPRWDLARLGIDEPWDHLAGAPAPLDDEFVPLAPYAAAWFGQPPEV